MKLGDWLTSILPAAVFKDPDLPVVLSASSLKEIELPEGVVTQFNAHYMTPDRAANDTNVGNVWKGKLWGYFADDLEREFKKIVPYLPADFQEKYNAIPKGQKDGIYNRLAIINEGIGKVAEGGQTEDVKQAAAKFREKEKELRDQVVAMETKTKKLEEDFTSKLNDYKIDFELRKKYQDWIPKLDQTILKTDKQKNFLIDQNIADLRNNFILEFDKENTGAINFLKKDRTAYYEGNELVSLDSFIEKQLDEFTVKNPGGNPPNPASTKVKTKEVNTGNMVVTAKDRRFAAAGAEAQA